MRNRLGSGNEEPLGFQELEPVLLIQFPIPGWDLLGNRSPLLISLVRQSISNQKKKILTIDLQRITRQKEIYTAYPIHSFSHSRGTIQY